MKRILKEILLPAGMMASLIVGAGMFSLPYVFARSGFIVGAVYLLLMAFVMTETHISYAEVAEVSGNDSRFIGYAKKYLGKGGEIVGGISVVLGILITLTIYLALSASFIHLIAPGAPLIAAVVFFWVSGSIMILSGIKKFAGLDILFFAAMAIITAIIAILGLVFGNIHNFNAAPADIAGLLFPLAPALFALSGRSAISPIRDYFSSGNYPKKNFRRAVALGTFVPVLVYAAFVIGTTMLSPNGVAEDAVSGLLLLPHAYIYLIGVLGFLSLITSYVFLGMEFKGIVERDLKFPVAIAATVVIVIPILFYVAGLNNFLALVGLAGGVFLAIESALVIMMRRAATLRHKPFDFILMAVFLAAMIYEAINFFS
jgi:amino acid permease